MRTHKTLIATLAALTLLAVFAGTAQAKDRRDDRRDRDNDRRPSRSTVVVREVRRPAPVITGHWENRTVSVLVEVGHWETIRVAARYEIRFVYGQLTLVCVQPECFERVWVPDRYEYRTQRVWVEDWHYGRRH